MVLHTVCYLQSGNVIDDKTEIKDCSKKEALAERDGLYQCFNSALKAKGNGALTFGDWTVNIQSIGALKMTVED